MLALDTPPATSPLHPHRTLLYILHTACTVTCAAHQNVPHVTHQCKVKLCVKNVIINLSPLGNVGRVEVAHRRLLVPPFRP